MALGKRLGPIVWQLPPTFKFDAARLEAFFELLPKTANEAIALANRMAPEHLVVDDEPTARAVKHAGAIFIGEHTAQVAGDYAIGSNHVLPTGGAARVRGGLSAADFVRIVSIQRVTRRGLTRLAPTVRVLAMAEGLTAHAQSIAVRIK